MASTAVEVFISYSHKDEALRNALATHLRILEREGIVASWDDRKLSPGTEWDHQINSRLQTADIILLLVSADFIASDYCWDVEIAQALERHDRGEAHVIPVVLRPVDWRSVPFSKLQALPQNAKPVVTWNAQDSAFVDIAKGIRTTARQLVEQRQRQEQQAQKQAALDRYRQQVRICLDDGEISIVDRDTLNDLCQTLGLPSSAAYRIEAEELESRQVQVAQKERYRQTFLKAVEQNYPLSEMVRADLNHRQTFLELTDLDVTEIETPILDVKEKEHQQQLGQCDCDQVGQLCQHPAAETGGQPTPMEPTPSWTEDFFRRS